MNRSLDFGTLATDHVLVNRNSPAGLKVCRCNPTELDGWDNLVLSHPDYSFFHSAAWARVLREAYGFTPTYLCVIDRKRLLAMLPVVEVKSWLTGKRGVSLPFTDACQPLTSDPDSATSLVDELIELGQSRGWKSWECRGDRNIFGDAPASLAFYGHTLALVPDEARMFEQFEAAVRRAIRKATREGLKVEISHTLEGIRTFYGLYCKTRRKHGLPPQPFVFFQKIYQSVIAQSLGVVVVAKREETPVAAAVFFHFGTKAVYKYGASDDDFQQLRGNNLVMWEAIRWLARQGFELLDFGRTSLANTGLRRFKLGWGATERRIKYVKYALRERRFLTGRDRAYGWHNHFFRVLPLRLAALVGAPFHRHLA